MFKNIIMDNAKLKVNKLKICNQFKPKTKFEL